MRQHIGSAVPDEVIQAARVDGASNLRVFRSVVLPMIRPAAAVLGLFSFMAAWNDFFWPLIVLQKPDSYTAQVALRQIQNQAYVTDYGVADGGHGHRHPAAADRRDRPRQAARGGDHGRGGQGMSQPRAVAGFPPGFIWGAATSSYQIEGATNADGRGPSIWDTFSATPGKVVGGDTGAVAADHYHRFREDIAVMKQLGLKMYRFSVAWPRVLPAGRGTVNQAGLDFYRRLVDELLANDIEPNLSLYHWDLPQALQDAGGWPSRDIAGWFADYAEVVYGALHDRVAWWSTINEPWCVSLLSHAAGKHAPGEQDPVRAIRAIHHVLLAHGAATAAMRAIDPTPRLGIVLNPAPVVATPGASGELLERGVRIVDGYRNRVWLDPLFAGRYPADMLEVVDAFGGFPIEEGDLARIATPIDWLGINYYNDTILGAGPGPIAGRDGVHPGAEFVHESPPPGPRTSIGWPLTPRGFHALLTRIKSDHPNVPPMMITENGAAYDDPIGPDGAIADDLRIQLPARPHRGGGRRHRGRRGRARLPGLVAAGQLRVGRGLQPAVRHRPRGLRDPGPTAAPVCRLVPAGHRAQRAAGRGGAGGRRRCDRRCHGDPAVTDRAPYRDPSLPAAERARDLLARMTLEEKLAQLGSAWVFELLRDEAVDAALAERVLGQGSATSRASRAPPTPTPAAPRSWPTPSSGISSRRRGWASRPSSTRRRCTG